MDEGDLNVDQYLNIFDKQTTDPLALRCLTNYPWLQKLTNNCIVQFCIRHLGIIYIFSLTFFSLYVGTYTFCPMYDDNLAECQYPMTFVYFILETMVNFAMFRVTAKRNRVDSLIPAHLLSKCSNNYRMANSFTGFTETEIGATTSGSRWKYCHTCRIVVPQRCHHCPLCNFCVLKKDHHCFVTGSCIGHANQRYFVVFVFWAMLSSGYAIVNLVRYLSHTYVNFWSFNVFGYIMPVTFVKLMFTGTCSWSQFGHVLLLNLLVTAFIGSVSFFVFQWFLIVNNQTMYERFKKQSYESTMSLMQRIQVVFGPIFLLNFLIPLPTRNKLDLSIVNFINECNLKEKI